MSVRSFVEAAGRRIDALHGLVLLRGGETVAEAYWRPYGRDRPHRQFSLSKSFTATACGFAVAEGLLDLDEPVGAYFGGRGDPRMLVRHLLTMTTGHEDETLSRAGARTDDWVEGLLGLPVEREPGTHFAYNTGATYLAGAIVQRLTGRRLVDYLRPRLFDPLGFGEVTWERCPAGLDVAGFGMTARTAEIARFGQLYLHDERGILPDGWAQEATRAHVPNPGDGQSPDWEQGYGLQFWRCRHGAFRGDGAFGQFCVVMPEQDLVLALNAGLDAMQPVLDLVWEHLLGDLDPADLPDLALPAIGGAPLEELGRFVVARPRNARPEDWRPSHEQPPTIRSITFGAERVTIVDETGTHEHLCRPGEWHDDGRRATCGGWTGPGEYTFRVAYLDGPFVRTYRCRFDGGAVTVTPSDNVSFGPTGYAPVHATRP